MCFKIIINNEHNPILSKNKDYKSFVKEPGPIKDSINFCMIPHKFQAVLHLRTSCLFLYFYIH